MPSSEPHYVIQITASHCVFRVLVNDIPVFEDRLGLGGRLAVPINKWIRSGSNPITIQVARPDIGSGDSPSAFSALVIRREGISGDSGDQIVASLELPPAVSPASIKGTFESDAPYPEWTWFQSVRVERDTQTIAALRAQVQGVYSLVAQGDLDGLLALFAERIEENAAAQYKTVAEQRVNSRKELASLMDSSYLKLQPLDLDGASLKLYAGGRLAALETNDGQSPIVFQSADNSTRGFVFMMFRRTVDGAWVVAR